MTRFEAKLFLRDEEFKNTSITFDIKDKAITCEGRKFNLQECSIRFPLGSSSAFISLSNNQRLEITEREELYKLYKKGQSYFSKLSQSFWLKIALFTTIFVLIIFLFIRVVVFSLGGLIAESLSYDTLNSLSSLSLESAKSEMQLSETTLTKEKQEKIQKLFSQLTKDDQNEQVKYKLLFFDSKIKNAFALPDGTIVVTDSLAKLLDEQEMVAVLAHEKAHVVLRHGVRSIFNNIGTIAFVSFVFGDITILGEILLTSHFSRDFEREADIYAAEYTEEKFNKPFLVIRALEKMIEKDDVLQDDAFIGLISSHPNLEERERNIADYIKQKEK